MKRVLLMIAFVSQSAVLAAPSIRTPQMPKGLSADRQLVNKKRPVAAQTDPDKPKKKIKRKGLQGYKKYHTFSDMTYEELKTAKEKNIASKSFEIASKYLERMITLCENVTEKAELIIELANIFYSQVEFDKAKKWYSEFEHLYPGNALIEQAKRQIILCSKQRILTPDRDQAPTEETLELAKQYLDRDNFTKYKDEVAKIKIECEELLAQADCSVANFYIRHGNYLSAEKRIKHVKDEWLAKVPAVATTVANLEIDLGAVWTEFKVPEESVKLTQVVKVPEKTSMANRF